MPNIIQLDYRERALITLLPDCPVRSLPVGDIWVGETPPLIIERKTVADLHASILDGRWREQKRRLQGHTCMILIEGILVAQQLPISTLFQSIINTIYRDGIPVLRTMNIGETVMVLQQMMIKTIPAPITMVDIDPVRSKRQYANNPIVIFQRQLACLPSISPAKAKAITTIASTWSQLRTILESNPNSLQKLMVGRRRLGPKTIHQLQMFYL